VSARVRRRRSFYDGNSILACYIASRSDIDDVIPNLVGRQKEWKKFHDLLGNLSLNHYIFQREPMDDEMESLSEAFDLSRKDLKPLLIILGSSFLKMVGIIRANKLNFRVRLLSSSFRLCYR